MDNSPNRDLSAKRNSLLLIWGLPLALLFTLNLTTGFLGPHAQVGVASVLFVWMGLACTVNALRCRRLHCIIAGPALLVGAALLALIAFGAIGFGIDGPTYVIWATLGIVALSLSLKRYSANIWHRIFDANL